RSAYWRQMLADISGLQLDYRTGGDVGPGAGGGQAGRSWRFTRSAYWRQMLADISGLQLDYRTGGDVGPGAGGG
ncbi:hypothetical protein C7D73_30710, partial [Klebsiella pneumoniae]